MKKILLVLFILNCSTGPTNIATNKEVSKIFMASYAKVWEATVKEISKYPLKTINFNTGVIVTSNVTIYKYIHYYDQLRTATSTYFNVFLTSLSEKPYKTKISITKFSRNLNTNKNLGTDLVDEQVILYRIKRNLILERDKIERTKKNI